MQLMEAEANGGNDKVDKEPKEDPKNNPNIQIHH
jgi:hypothetical protein